MCVSSTSPPNPVLGVVGTSRSSVCIAPPTTTDKDNVGFFGLKRRTDAGEWLPLPAVSGQRRTSPRTGTSSVSMSDSTGFCLANIILLFTKSSRQVDTCFYSNGLGAK